MHLLGNWTSGITCTDDVFELPYCSFSSDQILAIYNKYSISQALVEFYNLEDKITIHLFISRYLEKEGK